MAKITRELKEQVKKERCGAIRVLAAALEPPLSVILEKKTDDEMWEVIEKSAQPMAALRSLKKVFLAGSVH